MQHDIQRVLIDRDTITRRVDEIALQIARDLYALDFNPNNPSPTKPQLTLIPILTGSIIFVADLIRKLPLKLQIRLISVSSYPGPTTVSKTATVQSNLTNLPPSLAGHHVLLIDDILDSGKTLQVVKDLLIEKKPASIRTCVLLRKQRPQALAFPIDYVCFDIPDEFVVGYGLDYNDYYRNLPEIVVLKPEVFSA